MKLKDSKMNQRLLTCFIWITLCCGCTQSEVVIDNKPGKSEEVSACLRLNILASTTTHTRSMTFTTKGTMETDSISVTPSDNVTKSTTDLGEAADKTIQNLWVGQYVAGELVVEEYFSSLPTQESVNLPLKRIEGTSHVWVVANAGNLQGKASTEDNLKALTKSDAFTDDGLPLNNFCMMTGMWSGTVEDNISANIQLKRSVAKIKFTYSVGGTNFSFTPATLELCNVPVQMKYIGDETPVQLSGDENFKTYTVASPGSSGTHYWYIPENPAGTGSNTGDIATNKIGEGVTHATCIRLTGEAVQDGVTYGNVVFTLYPGNGNNDYNIIRNGLYTIDIKLTGIDFSDKRVTVGTVPDMQAPENLGAEKGATGIFQVTTRPGESWKLTVPSWLSAVVGDQTYGSGTELEFIGPYKVNFQTTTANPYAEIRETSFIVDGKTITVKQNPSSLTVGSSSIALDAGVGSTGSGTFNATKGLSWDATISSVGDWLAWNGDAPATGTEATGVDESLAVKATSSNPSGSERIGTLTVKAGESVGNEAYTGLKKEITVTQAGSKVTGSTTTVDPEAANSLTSSFTATPGLSWVASVANGSWITLATASGNPTNAQNTVAYNVTVNPNSSERSDDITVRAGDANTGPTGTIRVTQSPSSLTASVSPATLEATKDETGTFTMNGTEGLTYSFTAGFPDWLTVTNSSASTDGGMTTGSDQTLTYKTASVNPNASERKATVTVNAGNMTKDVEIKQAASSFDRTNPTGKIASAANSIITGSVTATAGLAWTITPATHNNITVNPTSGTGNATITFTGAANTGAERTGSFTLSATGASPARTLELSATQTTGETGAYVGNLQVCKTDEAAANWATANTSCENSTKEGKSDWHLPTKEELLTMYSNKAALQGVSGFTAFVSDWYWSRTLYSSGKHWVVNFNNGDYTGFSGLDSGTGYVRCVRDK